MKQCKLAVHLMALSLLILVMAACSGGSTPVSPEDKVSDVPASFGTPMDGGNVVAVYEVVIDPEAGTFTITPETRTGAYHFPLSQTYPSVVQITGYGWTPNFWADIKLVHPFPGSGIDGFDPRVIAVVPANAGVSFNYPSFAIQGNNKLVMQPDGYTGLYDNLGGGIAGNANPFKCYFKANPYRRWPNTGTTFETIRWNMNLTGFGGPIVYKLVVDVSSNFPAPPTPVTDNAKEPLFHNIHVSAGLTPTGGNATVEVVLLDWQGTTQTFCQVEAPALFNGLVNLAYDSPGPIADTYKYKGTISNTKLAPVGLYPIMVAGFDGSTQIYNYQEGTAEVKEPAQDKVNSIKYLAKAQDDTLFDICVMPNSYVYVAADHPDTLNTGPERTCLRYNNDLTNLVVVAEGTGLNYGIDTPFDRCDVSEDGYLSVNVAGQYYSLNEIDAYGNAFDLLGDAYQIWCGTYYPEIVIVDIWDTDSSSVGTVVTGFEHLPDFACGGSEYNIGIWAPDSDPSYSGLAYSLSGPPALYVDADIAGVNGLVGTDNAVILLSSGTEGRLTISGGWFTNGAVELDSIGSPGTGDGQFTGGRDVAVTSDGYILTLENHGASSRFQKFDSNLNWIYTSAWHGTGVPLRMDFDRGDNQLYLLTETGIHICAVD